MKMNDERLQRYYEAKRLREVEQKTLVQIGDELVEEDIERFDRDWK